MIFQDISQNCVVSKTYEQHTIGETLDRNPEKTICGKICGKFLEKILKPIKFNNKIQCCFENQALGKFQEEIVTELLGQILDESQEAFEAAVRENSQKKWWG